MSTEPEVITEPEVPAFAEYEVPGVGTVIDPQGEPGYRVRLPDGQVTAYPAASGNPSEANAASDIATAIATPPQSLTDQQIYEAQLAPGFSDALTGVRLKCTDSAQSKFTRMLVLLDLAMAAGLMTDATEVEIWDYDDAPQTITVAAFHGLMLRYGVHCKALFDQFAP
jgi:hypothetical protein